jgi:hypothetical protein
MVLLSAAIMILGGAVSAINLSVNSTQMNVNNNGQNQPLFSGGASDDVAGEGDNGDATACLESSERMFDYGQQHRGVVVYDNGMAFDNGGHAVKPTYDSAGAGDFSFYTGGDDVCITDVHVVYIFSVDPTGTNNEVCVEFYEDDGTGLAPGDLYAGPFCIGWNSMSHYYLGLNWGYPTYELGMIIPEVCFPGCGEKFWVSTYYNYAATAYWGMHSTPINGAMDVWKGTYFGYPDWVTTEVGFGIPYDWTFQLTQAAEHDVTVMDIRVGEFCECLPIEVDVANLGQFDEVDVPVHVMIKDSYAFYDEFYFDWTNDWYNSWWEAYGTTEGVAPHSASYMYEFKAGVGTWYGDCLDIFDFSNACNPYMGFWMWHDKLGSEDYIRVTANGNPVGPKFYRLSCPGCQDGWKYHMVQLPAGTTTVGFMGVADTIYDAYPIFVDDVEVFDMAYDETVLVDVGVGETVTVTMPDYCPCQWHVLEDITLTFSIHACTEMVGDETPINDCLTVGPLSVYIPFFHDVAGVAVKVEDQGCLDYAVSGTIANLGQYEECCFKVYADIYEIFYGPWYMFYFEDFNAYSTYTLPPGWTTNKPNNWRVYYYYYMNPYPPDYANILTLYYSPSAVDTFRVVSNPINTVGMAEVMIEFDHYLSHFSGPYDLYVETSSNGVDFTPIYNWHNPTGWSTINDFQLTTSENVGGSTFYFAFTLVGDSYNMNYWSINDVALYGRDVVKGANIFSEWFCVDTIDICEEQDIDFGTFSPEFGTPCTTEYYQACIKTALCDPMDENPANDEYCEIFSVDFDADIGVEITSPAKARNIAYANDAYPGYTMDSFDLATPSAVTILGPYSGANFAAGGTWYDNNWYVSDYGSPALYIASTVDGSLTLIGGSGTAYNGIAVDPTTGTMYGASSYNLYEINPADGSQTMIGTWGTSYLMIDIAIDNTGTCYGHDIVTDSIYIIDLGTAAATLLGSTGQSCNYAQGMEYDLDNDIVYAAAYTTGGGLYTVDRGTGAFTFIGSFPGEMDGFAIPNAGGGGVNLPKPDIWITCGEFEVCATVTNLGVFDYVDDPSTPCDFEGITVEWNMSWYYLTDPCEDPDVELILEGSDTIELACGESKEYCVEYDFAETGVYQFNIWAMPYDPAYDCDYDNNLDTLNIGVDCCDPITEHTLSPIMPDGCNNWYKQDVTVEITGYDPLCPDPCYGTSSGLAEIHYVINGVESVKKDDSVTFKIKDEGVNLVEYWGVDEAGNVEDKFTFEIAIDKTAPQITLAYEKIEDGTIVIKFKADVFDAISGIDKVEFFIGSTPETPKEEPPFTWEVPWQDSYKTVTFKAVVTDNACNTAEASIYGGDIPFAKVFVNSQSQVLSQTLVKLVSP